MNPYRPCPDEAARLLRVLQDRGWQVIHTPWGPRWYGPKCRSGVGQSEGEALMRARKLLKLMEEPDDEPAPNQ